MMLSKDIRHIRRKLLLLYIVYMFGESRFVVRTDNVANTFFKTQKKLSPKQARWLEFLVEYDFVWEHKLGEKQPGC